MLPDRWWQKPQYQLLETIQCAGHWVPSGFISDGATVPRIFWPVFPPIGRYLKATLVHDYYLTQGFRRYQCDRWFRECLIDLGISPWRVSFMYGAVRFYGVIKINLTQLLVLKRFD